MQIEQVKQFFQDPYNVMLASVLLLVAFNFNSVGGISVLTSVFLVVLTSVIVDSTIGYLKFKRLYVSETAVISGLVLSLVISPQTPLIFLIAAPAIAQLSKHVIRYKNKPVFNPAGLGMFLVFLLFPAGEAWWGNSITLLALILGIYISYRIARLYGSISFLSAFVIFNASYSFLQNAAFGFNSAISLIASQLFLALFMVIEPKSTTPRVDGQIVFGIVAALIAVIGFALNLPKPLLLGLLCANLAATLFK